MARVFLQSLLAASLQPHTGRTRRRQRTLCPYRLVETHVQCALFARLNSSTNALFPPARLPSAETQANATEHARTSSTARCTNELRFWRRPLLLGAAFLLVATLSSALPPLSSSRHRRHAASVVSFPLLPAAAAALALVVAAGS